MVAGLRVNIPTLLYFPSLPILIISGTCSFAHNPVQALNLLATNRSVFMSFINVVLLFNSITEENSIGLKRLHQALVAGSGCQFGGVQRPT
jgi:hypothetical protein